MAIEKVKITNFKCFNGLFELELNEGVNIIVGDNGSGKSTIIEAIHLALSGLYEGRIIKGEISQYLFNNEVVTAYLESIKSGSSIPPPSIIIELYFKSSACPEFEGNANSEGTGTEGLCFEIKYNDKYNEEYEELIKKQDLISLPIEYYDVCWTSFARQSITSRSIPIKSSLIDSSTYRYSNGSDIYISRIMKGLMTTEEVVSISQAHRQMKDTFLANQDVTSINERIKHSSSLLDGEISLSVDLGTKNAWENSLLTEVNKVPFKFIGKGNQCILKTELALAHNSAQRANVILLEEPESHLSFARLNQLISAIEERNTGKQIIISTHSSFVANKLGLDKIILIKNKRSFSLSSLSEDTWKFFKKIAGYDTLRMILCEKAILVEGDSDELVVQKAFMNENENKLPIEKGVDVISVGTSFLRFLEIAEALSCKVAVVTDNDGNPDALKTKYDRYLGKNSKDNILICFDEEVDAGSLTINGKNYNYNTLEPKLIKVNDLDLLNKIFSTSLLLEDMQKYMKRNKTACALAIFESNENIIFPQYVLEAIKDD